MINGIGVVGWGVGGIEAEAGMLGQPVYFLTPDVVGVHLKGKLHPGVHRDRPGADRHRDAAQGEGGRQVRRVLRRRHARRSRSPTAPRSATWRPSTARPWASSRSTTARSSTSAAPAAPRRRSSASPPTSRRRACSASRKPGEIDYSQVLELDLSTIYPVARRPEAPAGPHRPRQGEEHLHEALLRAGEGQRLRQEAQTSWPRPTRPSTAWSSGTATC